MNDKSKEHHDQKSGNVANEKLNDPDRKQHLPGDPEKLNIPGDDGHRPGEHEKGERDHEAPHGQQGEQHNQQDGQRIQQGEQRNQSDRGQMESGRTDAAKTQDEGRTKNQGFPDQDSTARTMEKEAKAKLGEKRN